MSTQYDDTNRFALFKNDKGDNPKRPDYTGKINVGGTEYRMSAWIREGQKGKFMSGSIDPIEQQQSRPAPTPDPFDDGSEIPF
jgi:hypothetical protein